MALRLALFVAAVWVSACGCGCGRGKDNEEPVAALSAPAPEASPAQAPRRSLVDQAPPAALLPKTISGPGPAYLAVRGKGGSLVVLDEQGFHRVHGDDDLSVSQFALGRDGTLWAGGVSGLYRLAGEHLHAVDMEGAPEGLTAMAVDRAGRVWVLGYDELGRHDVLGWVTQSFKEIDPAMKHARSLAALADGRILLSTMKGVQVWDGASWQQERFGGSLFEGEPMFGVLRATVGGERLVLATSDGTLERAGETWRRIDWVLPMADDELLSIGAGGRIVQASIDEQVAIKFGDVTEHLRLAELGLRGQDIQEMFVDDSGRLWFVTDGGLEILDAERELIVYAPSTVPELLGRIEGLFVVGSGPGTLPEAGPQRTGAVAGRLVVNGAAATKTKVEICPRPQLMYSGSSPCATAPSKRSAITDAEGRFRFEHVPIAQFGFTFHAGDGWKLTLGPSCCLELEPEGELELGDVSIDDEG